MGDLVWLDDERPAPEEWLWLKTYEEATSYFDSFPDIEAISFDHDLADQHYQDFFMGEESAEGTGYHALEHMISLGIFPEIIGLHSANPSGRQRMAFTIEHTGKYGYPKSGSIGRWTGVTIYEQT